jgi:hypothetical protein
MNVVGGYDSAFFSGLNDPLARVQCRKTLCL